MSLVLHGCFVNITNIRSEVLHMFRRFICEDSSTTSSLVRHPSEASSQRAYPDGKTSTSTSPVAQVTTARQLRNVLSTDKSRFLHDRSDGRIRVYRLRGGRYVMTRVLEGDCFGGGGVIGWDGIPVTGRPQKID